jgi:hypothetical protein
MLRLFKQTAIALACCAFGSAYADSIVKYEKIDPDGVKERVTISISGRWLRIDQEPKGETDYTLMDTGRMLMFEVDDDTKSFRQTRTGMFYWPKDIQPKLRPEREKAMIGGVRCQIVKELGAEKPIAKHCMAAGSAIGLNERKTKTLSRLFLVARRMGLGWGGVSTTDERQVSVSSLNLENSSSLTFLEVEHKPIPDSLMKIPDSYKPVVVKQKKKQSDKQE